MVGSDDEDTKPAIPIEVARRVGQPRRTPSHELAIAQKLAFEAMESIYNGGSGPVARRMKVEQWVGAIYDGAARELGDRLTSLHEANAILEREIERLRKELRNKDPRRER